MFNQQKGFTLVELITVLAIMVVALAIAAPNTISWWSSATYRESAQEVLQALRQGRSLAVSRNLEQRVEFDLANDRYRIAQGNRASSSIVWTTPVWTNLPNAVSLRAKSDCSDTNNINFVFRPNGTAVIQPAVVPATAAEVTATGFVCIMNANNLAEPERFIVSVQHNDTTAPVESSTGRSIIQ